MITSLNKVVNSDTKIYIKVDENKAIGFLKICKKKLFIRNESGKIFEINPLCLLDFYVHESVQRQGAGKVSFNKVVIV